MTSTRPPRGRRTFAAAALAVTAPLALGGCGMSGFDAQTLQQYQPGVGANVNTGQVQLYNALAVDNGDDTATLSAVVLNATDETQKLASATATTSDGARVEVETAPAIVGPRDTFNTGPAATVVFSGGAVDAGRYVTLTLTFDDAGEVAVEAPVVERTAMYSSVAAKPGGAD